MVPSEARWRYVAMLSVLLGGGALVLYGGGRTVATVTFRTVGTTLVVLAVGVYLFTEALGGYRPSGSG